MLAVAFGSLRGGSRPPETIRIGIMTETASVTMGPGAFLVREGADGKEHRLSWGDKFEVRVAGHGVLLGTKLLSGPVVVQPLTPDAFPILNGRSYHGGLEFRRAPSGRLTVINELPLDDYVKGILIHETSPVWPFEALKVQAVISRSYALNTRGRHGKEGYDLCDEIHCQVYGGRDSEREIPNRAVEETRGEVLTHEGKIIKAVFHSCCGGSTENSENIWEGPALPYLKAVRCRWCRRSPRYKWVAEVRLDSAARKLAAGGSDVGNIRMLRVLSRSRSGRAYRVRVAGSKGAAELSANAFRILLDGRVVRSTFWTAVSQTRDSWRFDGKGWGHGVGLCQWGTKAMADAGRNYKTILHYYYRNVKLERR